MRDTNFYLNAIRKKHGLTSDYQLAKLLNIRPNKISMYRAGTSTYDSDLALDIADLSGYSVAEIILNLKAQKATDPATRRRWARIAKKLAGIAACVILTLSNTGLFYGYPIDFKGFSGSAQTYFFTLPEYTLCALSAFLMLPYFLINWLINAAPRMVRASTITNKNTVVLCPT